MPNKPLRADGQEPDAEQLARMVRLRGGDYPYKTALPRLYGPMDEVCMIRKTNGLYDLAYVGPGGSVRMIHRLERLPE